MAQTDAEVRQQTADLETEQTWKQNSLCNGTDLVTEHT